MRFYRGAGVIVAIDTGRYTRMAKFIDASEIASQCRLLLLNAPVRVGISDLASKLNASRS